MKNIALVIGNAYAYAGTERVCSIMSEIYSENNNVDILSLTGEGSPFYELDRKVNIISFMKYKFRLNAIIQYLKDKNYDYVFVIGMGKLSLLFSILSNVRFLKYKMKFIACEHVGIHSFSFIKKTLKIITLFWYDKVIVLTDKDKKYLNKFLKNIDTIPNPINFIGHHRIDFKKRYIAIGRLSPQKGFDKLIEIWSKFSINYPEHILQIIGDGESYDYLSSLAKDKVGNNSIQFLGRKKNLEDYYKNSDAILMTSQYEGLPMVLLEAKSWSLPAIAFDCPTGPKEIIIDNYDGYLIPPNDQLKFLKCLSYYSSDLENFLRLQRNCEISSRKFSYETIKNKWLRLIVE